MKHKLKEFKKLDFFTTKFEEYKILDTVFNNPLGLFRIINKNIIQFNDKIVYAYNSKDYDRFSKLYKITSKEELKEYIINENEINMEEYDFSKLKNKQCYEFDSSNKCGCYSVDFFVKNK